MGALDELLAKWRENPDAGTTLALCTYLGTSRREELIREVGSTAEAWHKDDGQVMLAVGRMYLDAALLQEAQAALVSAGKLRASDAAPYRYLGEVLLRRGDAARAEKVLARALQMGAAESDTRMWHDRAVVYVGLQTRVGMRAVADEIDRTVPKRNSIPPPTLQPEDAERLSAVSTARAPTARPLPNVPPPPKLVPTVPPPPVAPSRAPGRAAAAVASRPVPASTRPPPPSARPPPARQATPQARVDHGPNGGEVRLPSFSETDIPTGVFDGHLLSRRNAEEGVRTDVMAAAALPSALRSKPPPPLPQAAPVRAEAVARAPAPFSPAPLPRIAPPALALVPTERASIVRDFDDSPAPAAETVLDHLARVGIYERGAGTGAAWAAAPREKARGSWLFVAMIVLAVGGGYGGFRYAHQKRQERLAMAAHLETEIRKTLDDGNVDDLQKTDEQLSHVFDLDSRSHEAAILWLRNRVLSALLLPGEPRGIESALARCHTLGIDEVETVFGKITSFLAQGDLAGAAAILPKWDDRAKNDPYYHLAAAAMLERAGDVRAIGRYQQAYDLDPDLILARIFHAELVTLELGIAAGKPLIDDVVKRLGDGPAAHALTGLGWALDPESEGPPPENARVSEADRKKLPMQMLSIPFVVEARAASHIDRTDEALAALDKGLKVSATPAMASLIGQVAIDLGDERLARQATLRALSYSALYPRARSLAARVALLGGRLDEAKSAIQELDAKSPEVAVVRAAAAYESLDLSELESASAAAGASGAGRALALGMNIVLGRKYPNAQTLQQIATPSIPWGDLVAVDALLDGGNLDAASKIVGRWGDRAAQPTYALRKARLLRYQGKSEDALQTSEDMLVAGGITPRVLVERFEILLANKAYPRARDFVAQYPMVLGPMTDFLKVTLDAADDKVPRAKAVAARLEPPPDGSPLLFELIAAEAFATSGDPRGRPMLGSILRLAPRHPDLVALAERR